MENMALWEAVLQYLDHQLHTERTHRTTTTEPTELTMCNECRAVIPEQGHFAKCETGRLIATIRHELGK